MTEKHAKNMPRLFIDAEDFEKGKEIALGDTQLHYLRNVMRMDTGDTVRVFNGRDGEWSAVLQGIGKKSGFIKTTDQLRAQKFSRDITLLAAPIKKEPFEWMLEKASEFGCKRVHPVITDHTVVSRVNTERARMIAVESAEQCERLDVMQVDDVLPLQKILQGWDTSRKILFCAERKEARPLSHLLRDMNAQNYTVLVGPEGGFSSPEMDHLCGLEFVIPVSLGDNVLRAETACIASLSIISMN